MKCLILAGGHAKRMGSLTREIPKPLLPLGEKKVIDYLVDSIPNGISIIVSTNAKYAKYFIDWKSTKTKDVKILIEKTPTDVVKIGACSAINYAIQNENILEDLCVLGGDNIFTKGLSGFFKAYDNKHPLVAIYDTKDPKVACQMGVVTIERGLITRVIEKPDIAKTTKISTACYILPSHTLHHLSNYCTTHKDNLGEFLSYLVAREPVYPYCIESEWYDIGTPEIYYKVQQDISSLILKETYEE